MFPDLRFSENAIVKDVSGLSINYLCNTNMFLTFFLGWPLDSGSMLDTLDGEGQYDVVYGLGMY